MLLTHLVESSSRGISMSKRELDDILKFGSKEVFEEPDKGTACVFQWLLWSLYHAVFVP